MKVLCVTKAGGAFIVETGEDDIYPRLHVARPRAVQPGLLFDAGPPRATTQRSIGRFVRQTRRGAVCPIYVEE